MGLFSKKEKIIEENVNQINNKELKEQLADNALAFLVNSNELQPQDFAGIKAEFGYVLMIKDHGLEALFRIIKDEKVYYFAVQQKTLKLLEITEEQFQSVTQHMLDLHVNNTRYY